MKGRTLLITLIVIFFAGQAFLSRSYLFPKWSKNYSTNTKGVASGLSPDQLVVVLAGFREMIAGILWVRADSFFHNGNYDAILPMIRLVTWLDPHQIDVYSTGMWHIAYNFTDEEQRSDRRYIPSALALGKEGANQNKNTYELFFETGWLWYHKVEDYHQNAVDWFKRAAEHDDMITARKNLLAVALQRAGKIDEALEVYYKLLDDAEHAYTVDGQFQARTNRDTIENNVDTLLVRMAQRGYFAQKHGTYETGNYDTKPPFDVGFSARVTVEEPMILRVSGTWNVLPVGTRIRVILRDADFPGAEPAGMDWDGSDDVNLDPPRDTTFMLEKAFVRNRRFDRRIDMSKDPTMYPFTKDKYVIEFFYDPRMAAHHIQDKFSWNGEGMTDKNYLNTEIRPGTRVIYAKLEMTRDQIKRLGEWRDKVPIVQTPNYVAPGASSTSEDIIQVPNIRAGTGK